MIEITDKEKDIYDTFRRIRAANPKLKYIPIVHSYRILTSEPAPRFYISFETARLYLQYKKRGRTPPMIKTKKGKIMVEDLYQRYLFLKNKDRNKDRKDWEIIEMAVNSPAQSFYVGIQTIANIITKLNKIL